MLTRRSFAASLAGAAVAQAAGTRVFYDDFTAPTLDSSQWLVGNWQLGRTILGNTPVIQNSIAKLPFKTWNAAAGLFTGCEIYTKKSFQIGNGLEFSARVRMVNLPKGLVTSLFGYAAKGIYSDEVDIEFLTKQIANSPGLLPLSLSTYNDFNNNIGNYSNGKTHWSNYYSLQNYSAADFHTYTIRLQSGVFSLYFDGVFRLSWANAVPNAAMPMRLNFWAPAVSWSDAFDASLVPAASQSLAHTYYYEVDWVEVRSYS